MYTVSEVVEIDKAQNLILLVTEKEIKGMDDIELLQPEPEAYFDE